MVVGCQPYAPTAFTSKKYSWYSFLLEAELPQTEAVQMEELQGGRGDKVECDSKQLCLYLLTTHKGNDSSSKHAPKTQH